MRDMSEHNHPADDVPPGPDDVRVDMSIPADPAQLQLLRSMAAALAVSLDFDIDTMADLRMAVDELGATMITRARPRARVSCRFDTKGLAVTVTAEAPVTGLDPIDRESFGWMVLTTLAESVTGDVTDLDGAGPRLRLSLTVRPTRAAR